MAELRASLGGMKAKTPRSNISIFPHVRRGPVEPLDDLQATTLPPPPPEALSRAWETPSCTIYKRGSGYVAMPTVHSRMSFLEKDEQIALVAWLRSEGIKHHSIPNNAARSQEQGADLKRQGLVSGVPDLYVFLPGVANIAIELKRANGVLSDVDTLQWDWHEFLPSCPGWFSCVAFGKNSAVSFVEAVRRFVNEGVPITQ